MAHHNDVRINFGRIDNYTIKGGFTMAHFYGEIEGQARTTATRRGSKNSGISAHVRGWDIGARVQCFVNDQGEDCVSIRLTSGSNGRLQDKCLGVYTLKDLEEVKS
jgi:hypothetical protein